MLSMIVIHATAFFLRNKITYYIWDINEWSVVTFLFCSAYLFFSRPFKLDKTSLVSYAKKRFNRLYVPYFVFLLAYFPLVFFLDAKKITLSYVLKNIFFIGGLDLNWLVLIFFELSIIFPLVYYFKEKKKSLYKLYFGLSLVSSIYFLFVRTQGDLYRVIMWLPWSLVIYFTIYFVENKHKFKKLFLLTLVSLLIFIGSFYLLSYLKHDLSQYSNKYPPNIFHLSYGIFFTYILYVISQKNIFKFLWFDRILNFLSINSYSLFFIHNLVIVYLDLTNIEFSNWVTFFATIFTISCTIQIGLNFLIKLTYLRFARFLSSSSK